MPQLAQSKFTSLTTSHAITQVEPIPVICAHCNGTEEVQRPDSEFLLPCPVCAPTTEEGK